MNYCGNVSRWLQSAATGHPRPGQVATARHSRRTVHWLTRQGRNSMAVTRRKLIVSTAAATAAASVPSLWASSASAASAARGCGRQDHRRVSGLVRLHRRRGPDQRLVALEPELGPAAVAEQQQHQGLARHARVHQGVPDRVRQSEQRPARDAVLVLRPVDGQHALPVDAAERLRHGRVAALQPERQRGSDTRRDGRQGQDARPRPTAASSTSCTTPPAGPTWPPRCKRTGPTRCPRTPRPRPTHDRTANPSCASGASGSTTPTTPGTPPPASTW